MQKQKYFEGLDAPLDRQLRALFERDMWSSYTPFIREAYEDLLGIPPRSLEDMPLPQEIDAETIEKESLTEVCFSG